MNVQDMVKNWDTWGRQDPMYSILGDRDKVNKGWNERDFFETGEKEIDQRITWFRDNGIAVYYGKALDFGCGLGRLTNALAKYCEVVHGVDISQSMIEQARKCCRYPNKIEYFQNVTQDLSAFKTGGYDLVYSVIVLQHIPTAFQISYVGDFLRLLSPRGIAFFQTIRAIGWRSLIPNRCVELYRTQKHKGDAFFPMYPIKLQTIKQIISQAGCHLLSCQTTVPEACVGRFCGDTYVVAKTKGAGLMR